MSSELKRIQKRKETRKEIEALYEKAEHVLIIHYSCESFYDIKDGRTPRATSIAVRNLKTAQTESFSIHKIAERHGVNVCDIPSRYDELEKEIKFNKKNNDYSRKSVFPKHHWFFNLRFYIFFGPKLLNNSYSKIHLLWITIKRLRCFGSYYS